MIANHVYEQPAPLPAINGLPAEVADLIARCLAKEPADRPAAVDAARILADASDVHVVLPETDGSSTQEVHGPRSDDTESWARRTPSRRQHALRVAVVALTTSGVAALLVLYAVRAGSNDATPRQACRVNFYFRPEGNRTFAARLTVVNTGRMSANPWAVTFSFPNGQVLNDSEGATLSQDGTDIRLNDRAELPPGKAVTVGLTGVEGDRPGPPIGFMLNGTSCATRLAGDEYFPQPSGVTEPPTNLDDTYGPPGRPPGPPPDGGPGGPGGPPPHFDPSRQPHAP
jgi:serine/threonine-protein kinase